MLKLWQRPGHANYLASPHTKGLYALLDEAVDSDNVSPDLVLMRAVLGAEILDASLVIAKMDAKLTSYIAFKNAVEEALDSNEGAEAKLQIILEAAQQARGDTETVDETQARHSKVLFEFAHEVGRVLQGEGTYVNKLEKVRTAHAELGDKIASAPFGGFAADEDDE